MYIHYGLGLFVQMSYDSLGKTKPKHDTNQTHGHSS